MPPPKSKHKLTPEQKDLIKNWIAQGAVWQPHWSFIPPSRPALPSVRNAAWVRNPIDAFLAAEHERRGLVPRPATDKATLLRYAGSAEVGGVAAGVGQRVLSGVAKYLVGRFFQALQKHIEEGRR